MNAVHWQTDCSGKRQAVTADCEVGTDGDGDDRHSSWDIIRAQDLWREMKALHFLGLSQLPSGRFNELKVPVAVGVPADCNL